MKIFSLILSKTEKNWKHLNLHLNEKLVQREKVHFKNIFSLIINKTKKNYKGFCLKMQEKIMDRRFKFDISHLFSTVLKIFQEKFKELKFKIFEGLSLKMEKINFSNAFLLILQTFKKIWNHLNLIEKSNFRKTNQCVYNQVFQEIIQSTTNDEKLSCISPKKSQSQSLVYINNEKLCLKLQQQRMKLYKSFDETLDLIIDSLNWIELSNIPENWRNNPVNKLNTNLIIKQALHDITKMEAKEDFENRELLLCDYSKTIGDLKNLFQIFLRKLVKIKDIEPIREQINYINSIFGEFGSFPLLSNKISVEVLTEDEENENDDRNEKGFGNLFLNIQNQKENIILFNEQVQKKEIKMIDELKKIEDKIFKKIKDLNDHFIFKENDILNIFREICRKEGNFKPFFTIVDKIEISTMENILIIWNKEFSHIRCQKLKDILKRRIKENKRIILKDFR